MTKTKTTNQSKKKHQKETKIRRRVSSNPGDTINILFSICATTNPSFKNSCQTVSRNKAPPHVSGASTDTCMQRSLLQVEIIQRFLHALIPAHAIIQKYSKCICIYIYIYIYRRFGGESNREIASCRAVRACVRAVG